MWRAVQAGSRASSKLAPFDADDDDLAKLKALRAADDSTAWIRKSYFVASAALLALFIASRILAHSGSHSSVFNYVSVTTFNSEYNFTSEEPEAHVESRDLANAIGCNEREAKLKVFMYDLPPEFHYGMLAGFEGRQTWPRNATSLPKYPGGLHQQHSVEYWLISDLLTSDFPDRVAPCTAFRVRSWRDADVMLVPYFASLSYNKYSGPPSRHLDANQKLQVKLVAHLKSHPAWRASGGADHVVVIHHPNSLFNKREALRRAMFVVADFGRFGEDVANMGKDVVAPYKHVISTFHDDPGSFSSRPTLLFFQGAIVRKEGGVIRQQLHALLNEEPDVVFLTGATTSAGIRTATTGMRQSRFCLHLAGDTPSSNRLFDAVASHCVPLIISDEIELPFEDVLDYSEFCLFVSAEDALKAGFVTGLLRRVGAEEWTRMWRRLREVERHFEYRHPTSAGDAVHMTWDAIARKMPGIKLEKHKRSRYQRSETALRQKTGETHLLHKNSTDHDKLLK